MNRFVIDASVAIKWVVEESGTEDALALRSRELLAPELIIPECANILWKKVKRAELTARESSIAARLLQRASIGLLPMRDMLESAAALAVEIDHPAYDCIYLVATQIHGTLLVTADTRLVRKASGVASLKSPGVLTLADAAAS